jgi:3-mercaptopyruvate sulfurtransferase SseA
MTDAFEDYFEYVPKPGRKFKRFTNDARQVVVFSERIARKQGLGYIDVADIRAAAAKVIAGETEEPAKESSGGHIPFTVEAKKVLEESLRVCLAEDAPEITPEHLLVASS